MKNYQDILDSLNKSKFRASFHLKQSDFDYIEKKGIDTIKAHTTDFITKRLAPSQIPNDGKQTPTKGHPVFIAQHATATCCRGCLEKWHKIPKNKELNQYEVDFVVNLIMFWIENQISNYKK